jgi:uncharacterized membrane protein
VTTNEHLPGRHLQRRKPHEFRRRGREVSRIEAFSDVVFGFALTLLVVSLEVPRTFAELMNDVRGFLPFAVCFAVLAYVWWIHHEFFRRYGLDDGATVVLNFILLFVVLFYVYPLKFMFNGIFNDMFGHPTVRDSTGAVVPWLEMRQIPALFVIYGLGYATVFLIFVLLYGHALRKKHELELSPVEIFETKTSMIENAFMGFVSLAVALIANILPAQLAGAAGYVFFAIPIGMWIIGSKRGALRRKLYPEASRSEERSA